MKLSTLPALLALSYGRTTPRPIAVQDHHLEALWRDLDSMLMAGERVICAPHATEQRAHEAITHQSAAFTTQNAVNQKSARFATSALE